MSPMGLMYMQYRISPTTDPCGTPHFMTQSADVALSTATRALCRIKLLPVTHVLVDTWMLTVMPGYKLLNVSDDLKWTTNTHVTPFSLTFKV